MAHKSAGMKSIPKGLTVKSVKKAGMWVVTFPKESKMVQVWFDKEPTKEQIKELYEQSDK